MKYKRKNWSYLYDVMHSSLFLISFPFLENVRVEKTVFTRASKGYFSFIYLKYFMNCRFLAYYYFLLCPLLFKLLLKFFRCWHSQDRIQGFVLWIYDHFSDFLFEIVVTSFLFSFYFRTNTIHPAVTPEFTAAKNAFVENWV